MTKLTPVKEAQLKLWRIEKAQAALATSIAAVVASPAMAKTDEILEHLPSEAATKLQDAMVNLAEVTSEYHNALLVKATELGVPVVDGGVDKVSVGVLVKSILGIS